MVLQMSTRQNRMLTQNEKNVLELYAKEEKVIYQKVCMASEIYIDICMRNLMELTCYTGIAARLPA